MIAKKFADGVEHSKTGELVAVGSRSQESAEAFGALYPSAKNRHGSYEALLSDDEVDAVYICTPHPMHEEWAIKAARAGKHILCEKPIGMNYSQAHRMVQAARDNDVFLMEGFMYRCSPQTEKIVEIIQSGKIGKVRSIDAHFSFDAGWNPEGRLLNRALGGGGILDVGCYPVSFARLIAGVADGKPFLDPDEVHGVAHLGETGVDEYASVIMKFPNNVVASGSCGVRLGHHNRALIFGTEAYMEIPVPWNPTNAGGVSKILLKAGTHRSKENAFEEEEILVETSEFIYGREADKVAEFLDAREASSPAMSLEDTLGNMKTLDRWRQSIGLDYVTD
jgi:predicted dehydrogenase